MKSFIVRFRMYYSGDQVKEDMGVGGM